METTTDLLTLTTFYEIAALLVLATLMGLVGLALRQPLIVSFLAVGILAGPAVLAVAQSTQFIELLAELGITILLFLVGLKLDIRLIRSLGPVALATGLGQVAFTSGVGFLICLALGIDWVTSAYIAVALTFSSTIIIVKLLTDKRETEALHGRIALGFLIVQDIVVVIALAVLSGIGMGAAEIAGPAVPVWHRLVGAAAFVVLTVVMWRLASTLLPRIAPSPELLITFTIGWAAMMAALGDYIGLGKELGGLAAGLALASSPLRETVAARLAGIREFLLLFFFIALGLHLDLRVIFDQLAFGVLLSVFVLVGNPIIVMIIMGAMGYRKRTGFLAGLTVAQISEFSFIFMATGLALGHVEADAVGLVTLVGLVTIAGSTYMIYYSHNLYRVLERFLGVFERRNPWREPHGEEAAAAAAYDAVVFGMGRYGSAIAERLKARGLRVLGVDFDPEALRRCRRVGIPTVFGDVADPDIWESLPAHNAAWAVCAVPGVRAAPGLQDPRYAFLEAMRMAGFAGKTAVTATNKREIDELRQAGADVVLRPFTDAAEQAAMTISGREAPVGAVFQTTAEAETPEEAEAEKESLR